MDRKESRAPVEDEDASDFLVGTRFGANAAARRTAELNMTATKDMMEKEHVVSFIAFVLLQIGATGKCRLLYETG